MARRSARPLRRPDESSPANGAVHEAATGRPNPILHCADDWEPGFDGNDGIVFPSACVAAVAESGRLPYLRWNPRTTHQDWAERVLESTGILVEQADLTDPKVLDAIRDPELGMARVIAGDLDAGFVAFARAARDHGRPLAIEPCAEVTGPQFSCNGAYNGAGQDEYGEAGVPDGPERFRDAFRHIVDLFRAEGAENVTWIFHGDVDTSEIWPWNALASYYPGDAYADWYGPSTYGLENPTNDDAEWTLLSVVLERNYEEWAALSPTKPIWLPEVAVCECPERGDKAAWITDARAAVPKYPRIRAFSWFVDRYPVLDENGAEVTNDFRVDSSPEAEAAWKQGASDPRWVTQLRFEP